MVWVPIAVWGAAVLLCAVVLGFCAYELSWKARRLQRDLTALEGLLGEVATLRAAVETAAVKAVRLAATGPR